MQKANKGSGQKTAMAITKEQDLKLVPPDLRSKRDARVFKEILLATI